MVRKRIGIEVSSICGLPSGRPFMIATAEPIMHPHQCSWCASIVYVPGPMFSCKACSGNSCAGRLCAKNTSWALIERPYSSAPQAVGAVYMTAQDFLCKAVRDKTLLNQQSSYRRCGVIFDAFIECNLSITNANDAVRIPSNVAFVRH